MSAAWVGLDDALRLEPRPNVDACHQAQLRVVAEQAGGPVQFFQILYENRDPNAEEWRSRAACAHPWRKELFFPQPMYPDTDAGLDPSTQARQSRTRAQSGEAYQRPSTVEPYRAQRISNAVELCTTVCPVYHQCLGWRLRVAGADKISIAAGLPWNTVKILLASTRRVAANRWRWRHVHQVLSPTVTGRDLAA